MIKKKLMEEMKTPLYVEIFKSSVNNRTSEEETEQI